MKLVREIGKVKHLSYVKIISGEGRNYVFEVARQDRTKRINISFPDDYPLTKPDIDTPIEWSLGMSLCQILYVVWESLS